MKERPVNRANRKQATSPPVVPEPDLARAVELVTRMLAIPGPSCSEADVARFVMDRLVAAGARPTAIQMDAAHRRTPLEGNCGNLVFRLPGTIRGPRRLLMAHLDTVPVCVGSRPVRRGNIIRSADPQTGVGADDRSGAAVVLGTAVEILERNLPHPPLTFFWTVQEELGIQGVRCASVSRLGRPKLAFNWDGGGPEKITVGATGGYRIAIEVHGVASHAGVAPELGVSAVVIAALAIADLQRNGWHGAIHKREGDGTSNIGMIQGGQATNVVADRVTIRAEARSHDPKFRAEIVRQIERAFRDAAERVRNEQGRGGRVEMDGRLDYESFVLPTDDPSLAGAEAAIRSVGLEPQRAVARGGLDANWMFRHGIPTATMGCGQGNQHMVTETLRVKQFETACRIALRLATQTEGG
jgi:tripeptide aminopeptidase